METAAEVPTYLKKMMRKTRYKSAVCQCGARSDQPFPKDYDWTCPACQAAAARTRRANRAKKDIGAALGLAGVPEELRWQGFENFEEYPDLVGKIEHCRRYAAEPDGLLFMSGDNDQGKSHLGMAILRELLMQGYECRYVSIPDLLMQIRASFDQKSGTVRREKWFIERFGDIEFAFFDDLGAEYVTDWTESIVYLILNRRIGKKTVVTSNLDLDGIEKIFSGRISSRLVRYGPPPLEFKGERYKMRGAR